MQDQGAENGGNEERGTGTGPELYLKTDKVGSPCEREWAQAWVERNSLSLLLSLNSSGLALAGGRRDLPLSPEMWIFSGTQYLAQLA